MGVLCNVIRLLIFVLVEFVILVMHYLLPRRGDISLGYPFVGVLGVFIQLQTSHWLLPEWIEDDLSYCLTPNFD